MIGEILIQILLKGGRSQPERTLFGGVFQRLKIDSVRRRPSDQLADFRRNLFLEARLKPPFLTTSEVAAAV